MKALYILLAPLLLAAQPIDLGLITDRRGFILTPTERTDVLRFEVTAQPSAMSNEFSFTLTNRLVQAGDLPIPNGPGLMVIQDRFEDGSLAEPKTYLYTLFRGVAKGSTATPVEIITPDPTGVVERAFAIAKLPPPIVMPPLPPATPLPDAAPEGMRHYYQRARRDGSPAMTNSPRSRIRRFR